MSDIEKWIEREREANSPIYEDYDHGLRDALDLLEAAVKVVEAAKPLPFAHEYGMREVKPEDAVSYAVKVSKMVGKLEAALSTYHQKEREIVGGDDE